MDQLFQNRFLFSPRYRVWRHLSYWSLHVVIWAAFWVKVGAPVSYGRQLVNMLMWVPCFILFSYPLAYMAIPKLLLPGKLLQFIFVMLLWGFTGLYIDIGYRNYVLIPVQEGMGLSNILPRGKLPFCYLCMTTSAASPMILQFFKRWMIKQKEWLQALQEKTTAELQLLKSQVHPHFLFNTLNNIYSFSLTQSPETPGLVRKLTSLLHYMLNDCKSDEVKLQKEIEIMKYYVDLEKERYGNKIDITWRIIGEVQEKMIAPLLLLPFLENAFKHGISDQLSHPSLFVEIVVRNESVWCNITNSKNEIVPASLQGIGIENVRKRMECIYPGKHQLRIEDAGQLFHVSMYINLNKELPVFLGGLYTSEMKSAVPA